MPADLFKVVDGLFVSLKRLEKFENVHGCTFSFDALQYQKLDFCQVQKRTIQISF